MTERKRRNKVRFLAVTALACVVLAGCQQKTLPSPATSANAQTEAVGTGDVREFLFSEETSKIYLTKNGEEATDITSFVTGVADGVLYLNPDGLRFVFEMGERDITQEEKDLFLETLKEHKISTVGDEYLCLSNKEHQLLLKEGSKMYLMDGKARMLDAPCIRTETGVYSIPITDLVFAFGYDSIGSSVKGDSVTYTMVSN